MTNGAVFPVVDIGATDTGVVDGNKNIVIVLKLGLGLVDVGDIMGFVQGKGEVLNWVSMGCCGGKGAALTYGFVISSRSHFQGP